MGKNNRIFWNMSAGAIPPSAPLERIQNFNEFHPTPAGGGAPEAGGPVHGLRRALLPVGR